MEGAKEREREREREREIRAAWSTVGSWARKDGCGGGDGVYGDGVLAGRVRVEGGSRAGPPGTGGIMCEGDGSAAAA